MVIKRRRSRLLRVFRNIWSSISALGVTARAAAAHGRTEGRSCALYCAFCQFNAFAATNCQGLVSSASGSHSRAGSGFRCRSTHVKNRGRTATRDDKRPPGISMRAACEGTVANEVDAVADTVERPPWLQAFRHHTGHSLHGQLRDIF